MMKIYLLFELGFFDNIVLKWGLKYRLSVLLSRSGGLLFSVNGYNAYGGRGLILESMAWHLRCIYFALRIFALLRVG